MSANETIRFHIDRRGRILVENVTRECLKLAEALVPDDAAVQALLRRATPADRRNHDPRRP